MKRILALAGTLISIWASPLVVADEPSNIPKPIPATRPEMKAALEALKERQPRISLPVPGDGEASVNSSRTPADYLPETWGRGGGLAFFGQINHRGASVRTSQDPDARSDDLFSDPSFWVVSRGNNCHYCLGHQELKLRAAGLDDDTIAALDSDWSRFDPRERAALAFARKLTLEPELVGDADIAKLKEVFSDPKIIELAFTIALFNSVNRWTDGMGLPQEHHFSGDREDTLMTPTSEKFSHIKSIVIPTTRTTRPPLATSAQAQQAIAASQTRVPRVTLPAKDATRKDLIDVIGDREPYEWERALTQLPVSGKAYVTTWNIILSDDNLTPRLKSELAFITAVNNRAWYAAAHAAHRLKQLGASPEDLTSLLSEKERSMGGAAAAYHLAAKSTANPHLITDADIAQVREHYSDAETAEIMQVICMANLFDRFTEALGLPLEDGIANGMKLSQQ
jgi:alkylhydroperoxidase family enzyme